MHKRIKHLIKNLKNVFDVDEINKIAKETKFVQRKSSINTEDFLVFNVFHGADICSSSLSQLASKYDILFDTQISKQALYKRFNEHSVKFMQEIFNQMMMSQNATLKDLENTLNLHFNRVIINDSTGYALPKEFKDEFAGSGGSGSPSSIKIQLQYELLTGPFMRVDIFSGTKNYTEYLDFMKEDKGCKDLKLDDLGYFKIEYLKEIDKSGSSFISKIKSNTSLYMKNPNPKKTKSGDIIKCSEYIKIDFTHKKNIRKKNITSSKGRANFNSVNVYITNVTSKVLTPTHVHDLYTLRWQIEIMFKVWKSIFKINHVKKVKMERFKCFLYGRLIALLLSSSIVFTAKNTIWEEDNKEISEIKSFAALAQYLPKLAHEIFKGEVCIIRILQRIILNFKRLCIKSRKKHRKTVFDILEIIELKADKIEKIAI